MLMMRETYLGEFFWIDTDGDSSDVDGSAFIFDCIRHGWEI